MYRILDIISFSVVFMVITFFIVYTIYMSKRITCGFLELLGLVWSFTLQSFRLFWRSAGLVKKCLFTLVQFMFIRGIVVLIIKLCGLLVK